jgi:hypothetical protein
MYNILLFALIVDVLTPSLLGVKPFHYSVKTLPTLEIEEFNQLFPEAANPHTTYVNNFYIYPLSLNYNNQKVFSKVNMTLYKPTLPP